MARGRAVIWAGLGAAGAAAALAASPGAYAWVRRLARLEDDRRFYEEDAASLDADAPEPSAVAVDDAPVEDVRLSLRARLQDAGAVAPSPAPAATPASVPASAPVVSVDEARARLRQRAASASRGFEDAPAVDADADAAGEDDAGR